jgi:uncharacterized membrane protein
MDVLELVHGHGRRLDAAEREIAAMRERIARLEGAPAPRAAQGREAVQAPRREAAPHQAPSRGVQPPPAASRAPRQSMLDSTPPTGAPAPPPRVPAAPPQPKRERPSVDLEELLGGRILGLAGALAVLLGIAFLVAMAVDRGWIDEPTRIAIGFGGCTALLLAGVYLYERRGRTQAALAATGAAVAGLFATLTAGAQLYELFPVGVSLAIAAAIGVAATALALRWDARTFAALGLLGAMIAPWLVGSGQSSLTIAFVLLVLTIAFAVAQRRGWEWLTFSASGTAAVEVGEWLGTTPDALPAVLALAYLGFAHLAAAAAAERAGEGDALEPAAAALVAGVLLFVAPAGFFALDNLGMLDERVIWLGGVAAAGVAAGLAGVAAPRISRDLAHLPIAIGIGLADIAFVLATDGVELALGWAGSAAALLVLARLRSEDARRLSAAAGAQLALALAHTVAIDADPSRLFTTPTTRDEILDLLEGLLALGAVGLTALLGARLLPRVAAVRAAGHAVAMFVLAYGSAFVLGGPALAVAWALEAVGVLLLARRSAAGLDPVGWTGASALAGLALTHALTIDADPSTLWGPAEDLTGGAIALGAIGAGAVLGAQLLPRGPGRYAANALALFVLAYASAFVLHGPALAAAWAVEAAAVLALAVRSGEGIDPIGWAGSLSLLGLAVVHGVVFEAVPDALVYGVDDLLEAAVALAFVAAAAISMAILLPPERREERLGFASLGAAALVYLGSVAIVTAFQPDPTGFETATGVLDERQQGQLLLSAFWAVAGVAALVAGLARGSRAVRVGGFVLLGIATTKVFLFDLSALEALYRVGSFVALGLLLLGAAFAWQRNVRPPQNGGAEA